MEKIFDLQLAFPYHYNVPVHALQFPLVFSIAVTVVLSLCFPEFCVCLRIDPAESTLVHVPETPVSENHLLEPRDYKIRSAWQITLMQPVPVSQRMNKPSYDHLGPRVFRSD